MKYVGGGNPCVGQYGVFIDLFTQGFELAVSIAEEVKFFEVKIDLHAPELPIACEPDASDSISHDD